jgi:predicted ABC-type transport system involved in lysophospholipase L1 biosynthesis ATPase subunit
MRIVDVVLMLSRVSSDALAPSGLPVLRQITFAVVAGEFVAMVMSPRDGDWSALRNVLTGRDRPTCGTVFVDGNAVHSLPDWSSRCGSSIGVVAGTAAVRDVLTVMAARPRLLLADEPTWELDRDDVQHVVDRLRSVNRFGQTVLMLTHDLELALHCARRVVMVRDGRIVRDADASLIAARPSAPESQTAAAAGHRRAERGALVEEEK